MTRQARFQPRDENDFQPVVQTTGEGRRVRRIPSLKAIEQPGGPEVDGPLILPDREVWSSRLNELMIDLQ